MRDKSHAKTEFGDFQTPPELAHRVCSAIQRHEVMPAAIVEPTCGTGTFLETAERTFPNSSMFLGYEINEQYVRIASARCSRAVVSREDFFAASWQDRLQDLPEPILILGNPPWITNSAVGAPSMVPNLPSKSNSRGFKGIEAITGKSNFDISEWMITHLLECLDGRRGAVAMLCKTVVARNVLKHAWGNSISIEMSAVHAIDTPAHFSAAVDACLLVCKLSPIMQLEEMHRLRISRGRESFFRFRVARKTPCR